MIRTEKEEYCFGNILLLANKLQIWGDGIIGGLTTKQFFLLLLISKMNAQSPTVKEVADFTGTSRQNVKKMLGHLEIEGYVSLARSKTDARAWSVCLTEKTFGYFTANRQKSADAMNKLFSNISDSELEIAIRVLEKLFSAIENNV